MMCRTAQNGVFILHIQIRKSPEAMLWGRRHACRNKEQRHTAGYIYSREQRAKWQPADIWRLPRGI